MDRKAQSERLNAFWQEHINAWSQTKQSQTAYCQSKALDQHQFSYWKRKLLGKSDTQKKLSGFVPVLQDRAAGSGLSLTLPNGLVIQGIAQHNLSVVDQLLRQL